MLYLQLAVDSLSLAMPLQLTQKPAQDQVPNKLAFEVES